MQGWSSIIIFDFYLLSVPCLFLKTSPEPTFSLTTLTGMKKTFLYFFLLLLSVACGPDVWSQKKIVVLGSSSAAGNGATTGDSSWVGRLRLFYNRNTADGIDTTIINLAQGGGVTYWNMPTSYTPPPNRPCNVFCPKPDNNVTKAMSFNPDIVIVNLPSNDVVSLNFYGGYTVSESMQNFRVIRDCVLVRGAKFFVTTSQPRNDIQPQDFYQRQQLKEYRDSIMDKFSAYAINVWDTLVTTDGSLAIRSDLVVPDNIHPNNTGHRYIFEKVRARNIFADNIPIPVPVRLLSFTAKAVQQKAAISWQAESEEASTVYEVQRSADGQNFQTLYTQQAFRAPGINRYVWADAAPLKGKSFYRLKISENGRTFFSSTQSLTLTPKALAIAQLQASSSVLNVRIEAQQSGRITLAIVNDLGATVQTETRDLQSGNHQLQLPISSLAAGRYYLRASGNVGIDVAPFQKMY
jgi:hypothetical protein